MFVICDNKRYFTPTTRDETTEMVYVITYTYKEDLIFNDTVLGLRLKVDS